MLLSNLRKIIFFLIINRSRFILLWRLYRGVEMKKALFYLAIVLIFTGCDGSGQSVLKDLEGDWQINLGDTTFDFGDPAYVDDYVTLSFNLNLNTISFKDGAGAIFEVNRIVSIATGSTKTEGGITTLLTVFTPDPSWTEGDENENYWTYNLSGDHLIIEAFDDDTKNKRFVRIDCTKI